MQGSEKNITISTDDTLKFPPGYIFTIQNLFDMESAVEVA